MYYLHRRTRHGVSHLMGEYETDYVTYAFKDCVSNHAEDYIWITTDANVPFSHNLVQYDPDHHDYLEVDDWDIVLPTA